jgi:hypothetical protein
MLRRYIPEPLVRLVKGKAVEATLKAFDSISETPELFWTAEMREELRRGIRQLLHYDGDIHSAFCRRIDVAPGFTIPYKQLDDEIYVGEVYIRLYLKQRTYRLSNPVHFLEQLIVVWESSFNSQVPLSNDEYAAVYASNSEGRTELILGKEDFLSLLTSSIVCVLSSEESIFEHLVSWGFDHRLVTLLGRALQADRRGTPVICTLRLLRELVRDRGALNHIVYHCKGVLVESLLGCMKASAGPVVELHNDVVLTAEVIKIVFQTANFPILDELTRDAIRVKLPEFILNHVLGSDLANVRNAAALRVYCVDALKSMCEAEESTEYLLQLLDSHKAWSKYKSQNHSLYLTVRSSYTSLFITLSYYSYRRRIKWIRI